MFRSSARAFVAIALAGCSGESSAWSPGDNGDAMAPGDAASSTSSGSSGGSSSGGHDGSTGTSSSGSSGSFYDASGPTDSGGGSVDAPPPPPYDGPPGQFVYGPPSGTTGLPGLLSSVQIVTVTWGSDTENIVSQIATAFGGLESSAWWSAVNGYCVPGASTCVGKPVTITATHVGDPPGQPITDSATAQSSSSRFPKFVADKSKPGIGGKPPDLPTPVTASTLYVFFMPLALPATSSAPALPQGYAVTVDGAPSCGYHSATAVNGIDVAYVVIPRCQVAGQSDANVAIARAFQEIADAVTDPFRAEGRLGFNNPAAKTTGFEIGDFCPGMTGTANGVGGFSVPQVWSNSSMGCAP